MMEQTQHEGKRNTSITSSFPALSIASSFLSVYSCARSLEMLERKKDGFFLNTAYMYIYSNDFKSAVPEITVGIILRRALERPFFKGDLGNKGAELRGPM